MKWVYRITLLSAIFLSVVIGSCIFRGGKFESGFLQVETGQNQETVTDLMGKPSEIKSCMLTNENLSRYPNKDCSEIYGYFSFTHYWAVAFDKNGEVVKKFRWTFDDGYEKPKEFDFPLRF